MTTLKRLQAEAHELYPESYDAETGHHVDDWGYSECQREAHVRAKTISPEKAGAIKSAISDELGSWPAEAYDPCSPEDHQGDVDSLFDRVMTTAGFCVEGEG